MRNIFYLMIACLAFNSSAAQQIDMKMNLLGYKFVQDGKQLKWKELETATAGNREAFELVRKANAHRKLSGIAAFIGGLLIGIPIGQQNANLVEPNWTLAYIGGGISAIGVPFSFSAFNKVNRGVDTYNLGLKSASRYALDLEIKTICNRNGIGLAIQF